jgi:hypothetical protein
MAATRLTDVIVPDVWNPYLIERTAELSALFQSQVIQPVEDLQGFESEGGNTVNMPFWQDLSGDDEVLSATGTELTVNNIESEKDVAVILARGKAWGVNELAAQLSGDDPAAAIADLVAGYWNRRIQAAAISILQGVFGSLADESPAVNVLDISENSGEAGVISADALLDAQQLLGDAKSRLTALSMHSAVENALAKQDVIEYERPSDNSPRVPVYGDKSVIVDDSHPNEAVSGTGQVYDTYLFGPGALGWAEGTNSKITMTETDRDALRGEDILINRRHFILHPRGVKYDGAATGGGPANNTLANAASWERVYEPKNVRMVLLRHRI